VYGLALYAVGRSVNLQVRAAHLAGVLQLILALGGKRPAKSPSELPH